MGSSQQFSLRWNNYLKYITCAFDTLRTDEDLVDVTLSCEGKRIRAHKMLLSACSTYFRDLFKENPCQHPVIIFRNVKFDDLAALVDFMYQGEVNVVQEQLASFLTTAELLAVQGLTDGTGKDNDSLVEDDIEIPNEPEVQLQNISGKSIGDSKRNKSPMPYHAIELQPEVPPNKRRKTRDRTNANMEKNSGNAKDSEEKTLENQTGPGSDPVEIIPLMPSLKLEMPEYLEQDASSCSYEDQNIGDNALNKITIDDTSSNTPDHKQKPDISQTFYSSQSISDDLDGKHQTDVGHLLSKPSTSGERVTQEAVQDEKIHKIEEKIEEKMRKNRSKMIEEKMENRSKMIEETIKEQVSQACENATSKIEEILKKACISGDSTSGISSETENKIHLGSGFYCTPASFSAMKAAKNDSNWAVALLVGVFGEDAKLMRIYPRKEGLKKFPLGFLMLAQNLYRERIKDYEGNIDEMVRSLPAYLSDRALDLGGGRKIFSPASKSKNISQRVKKEATITNPSIISTTTSSTKKKKLHQFHKSP